MIPLDPLYKLACETAEMVSGMALVPNAPATIFLAALRKAVEAKQECGHPLACVVRCGDGTSYCMMCEATGLIDAKLDEAKALCERHVQMGDALQAKDEELTALRQAVEAERARARLDAMRGVAQWCRQKAVAFAAEAHVRPTDQGRRAAHSLVNTYIQIAATLTGLAGKPDTVSAPPSPPSASNSPTNPRQRRLRMTQRTDNRQLAETIVRSVSGWGLAQLDQRDAVEAILDQYDADRQLAAQPKTEENSDEPTDSL